MPTLPTLRPLLRALALSLSALATIATLGACATEEEPPAPASAPKGPACAGEVCEEEQDCATYATATSCVDRCVKTSDCGTGRCCSYAHSAVGAYCVSDDDVLGRAGAWCKN